MKIKIFDKVKYKGEIYTVKVPIEGNIVHIERKGTTIAVNRSEISLYKPYNWNNFNRTHGRK